MATIKIASLNVISLTGRENIYMLERRQKVSWFENPSGRMKNLKNWVMDINCSAEG